MSVEPDSRPAEPLVAGETPAPLNSVWNTVIPRSRISMPDEVESLQDQVAPEDLGYQLIDRPEPPPVPNGWYAALALTELSPGAVSSFIAVERELVAFRTDDGDAHVIDAHCPHMGAHLGG